MGRREREPEKTNPPRSLFSGLFITAVPISKSFVSKVYYGLKLRSYYGPKLPVMTNCTGGASGECRKRNWAVPGLCTDIAVLCIFFRYCSCMYIL
jgi:hypothetical protein